MGITAAMPARLARALHAHDPDLAGLRRAARAAVVIVAILFIVDVVLRQPQMILFAVFGSFALLVMADFRGPRRSRAIAYLVGASVGVPLVALGTLVSPVPWLAAVVMFLVGFGIQLSGALGGYVVTAEPMLLMAFVLGAAVPAPADDIGLRVAGWALAGACCTIAGVFFWPRIEVVRLHRDAATACRAVADLVDAERRGESGSELEARRRTALDASGATNRTYEQTSLRPTGQTGRDRARAELLGQLVRINDLAREPMGVAGGDEVGDGLAREVVATLRSIAGALESGTRPDLAPLVAARADHTRVLAAWVLRAMRDGRSPEEVLDAADADHTLRTLSYLVLALGANAVVVNGGWVEDGLPIPAGTPVHRGPPGIARRVGRAIRTHFHPTSSVLRGSVRVGLGLALAVLLARVLSLEHGFWVVLGTISVLRTTAVATGRTVLQALVGTLLGFAIASAVIVSVGRDEAVLWVLLPVCVFLAAYVTGPIGFVAGQAAFTLYVIVLFNLIAPAGWKVGLLRLEDVAVGCGVSIVVGFLLWPRGARYAFREAIAGTYRSLADFLDLAYEGALKGMPLASSDSLRAAAMRGMTRMEGAFDQFLSERGSKPVAPADAARLVSGARRALNLGDVLNVIAGGGASALACPDGRDAIAIQAQKAVGRFRWLTDELASSSAPEAAEERPTWSAVRAAAIGCLERWRGDMDAAPAAIALEWIGDHIRHLDDLCGSLEGPVARTLRGRGIPWWR